jgi:NnrS protein
MSIARLRNYQGPAILSYGFRPFFLLGAIYAALAIPLWLAAFEAGLELPTAFAPRDWHVHEMLYGFVASVIGGFLLTAIAPAGQAARAAGLELARRASRGILFGVDRMDRRLRDRFAVPCAARRRGGARNHCREEVE